MGAGLGLHMSVATPKLVTVHYQEEAYVPPNPGLENPH